MAKRENRKMTREKIIMFPKQPENRPLLIQLAGISWCDGSYCMRRNNSSTNVFEYVVSGRGHYRLGDQHFYPEAGDVYIVPHYSEHEYRSSASDPWVKLWFNVCGPLIPALLDACRLTGLYHLKNCPVRQEFEQGLALLQDHPEQVQKLGPQVMLQVIMAIAETRSASPPGHSPESERLRQLLEQYLYTEVPSLQKICRAAGCSLPHAIRIFKKDFGLPPHQYLLERKIEIAGILLKESAKSIKQIAAEIGFPDEYYFSRLFKKRTGVSPSDYRGNRS